MTAKMVARLILVGLIVFSAGASAVTHESLGYQVVYRGVFSLGQDMAIADIRLASELPAEDGTPPQMSMVASSAAYGQVESLYPIRYRFRSWVDAASGQLIGLEAYEKTHREKHRLYLRDDSAAVMRRVDPAAVHDGEQLARLLAVEAGRLPPTSRLFDRLGLLQQLRRETLRAGAVFEFPVTNGRDRMHYRVRVEKATRLRLGGGVVPSWKLRLDATEVDEHGHEVEAHRPVYLWLSRDARQIPLRVDVRHAIGRFRVQLSTPLQQIALLGTGS